MGNCLVFVPKTCSPGIRGGTEPGPDRAPGFHGRAGQLVSECDRFPIAARARVSCAVSRGVVERGTLRSVAAKLPVVQRDGNLPRTAPSTVASDQRADGKRSCARRCDDCVGMALVSVPLWLEPQLDQAGVRPVLGLHQSGHAHCQRGLIH